MTRHYSDYGFDDPENAERYAAGAPRFFLPGFDTMHALTIQLLGETAGRDGRVLVLGAGGGLELRAFLDAEPNWRLTAVDPSPQMLAVAKNALGADAEKIEWSEAYIPDAPPGPFDAASCLLTLHVIPDDGQKRDALKAIRSRLKPGGLLAVVDNTMPPSEPAFETKIDRFLEQARRVGVAEDQLERVREANTNINECVTEARETALFAEAGFSDVTLYFASLSWRGWIARAA